MNTTERSTPAEVLVVEDTPASLQLLSDLLGGAGYVVRRAQDGHMALLSAQARAPDLILLDVRMPGMDGYEVCRRLKGQAGTRDVPVIFLSALHETEDKVRGFQAGGVDYVAKPYQAEEVLARVRTHVELHRLRADLEARVEERTGQIRRAERELAASEARLRELAAFLQKVREDERARIARELHDELGQALTALRLDLAWLRNRCAGLDAQVAERLAGALMVIEQSVAALRRIAEDLRPAMLDSLGLAAAVEHYLEQFSQRTGLACRLSVNQEEFDLDEQRATALFRMIQEALTNVARHAAASEVEVRIEADGHAIEFSVRDNGVGFTEPGSRKTFGLLGMRERAKMLGGHVTIAGAPGGGTLVAGHLPLEAT